MVALTSELSPKLERAKYSSSMRKRLSSPCPPSRLAASAKVGLSSRGSTVHLRGVKAAKSQPLADQAGGSATASQSKLPGSQDFSWLGRSALTQASPLDGAAVARKKEENQKEATANDATPPRPSPKAKPAAKALEQAQKNQAQREMDASINTLRRVAQK